MTLPTRSVSENTNNNISIQVFGTSVFNDRHGQCNTNRRPEFGRPGLYQVNYYKTPQTQVNDDMTIILRRH